MRSSARVATLPDLAPSRLPGVAASSLSRFSHSLSMSDADRVIHSMRHYITRRRRRNANGKRKTGAASTAVRSQISDCALLDFGSLHMHEEFVSRIVIRPEVPKHSACSHVRIVLHNAANHRTHVPGRHHNSDAPRI